MSDPVPPPGFVLDEDQGFLDRKAQELLDARPEEVQEDPVGALDVFTDTTARGLIDFGLGVPKAVLHDIPATGTAGVTSGIKGLGRMLVGQPPEFSETFAQDRQRAAEGFPLNVTGAIPAPTTIDLEAIGKSAGAIMSDALSTPLDDDTFASTMLAQDVADRPRQFQGLDAARDEVLSGLLDDRIAQPSAAGAGDAIAGGLSLLSGRAPGVRSARNQRLSRTAPVPSAPRTNDVRQAIDDVLQTGPMQKFRRGLGRTAEAGFEGMLLAATQDRDPLTGLALGAGSQAVGSAVRTAAFTKGGLAATAASGVVLWQMFKEATPGGRDRILESTEDVIGKMTGAVVLGALATLGGAGRAGRQADNIPILSDAIHSIPRGTFQTLLNDWANDPETFDAVFGKLQVDPEFFGAEATRRLERSMTGNGPSPKETIELLSDSDRQFRRKLNTLIEQGAQISSTLPEGFVLDE